MDALQDFSLRYDKSAKQKFMPAQKLEPKSYNPLWFRSVRLNTAINQAFLSFLLKEKFAVL
ncbi:MAG: hypothetical protein DRR08_28475 [Candidatus Parabeggiatoa sp. nov. 2]|nr:MAG: hypothetical protein DRR08_28475 [Gammaproteobacteria bacterium]